MSSSSYVEIAFFLKTHGLKGELKAVVLDTIQIDFSALDTIFLKIKGQFIPYFIEATQDNDSGIFVKLDEVDSREIASALRGQRIYIPSDKLKEQDTSDNYNDLIGYLAYNNDDELGTIENLELYPQQIMAKIKTSQKEVLIPLVEDFIMEIDDEKKKVYFQLPEGLLDL